jgi:flagellar hook assembly protein FlgD
LLSIFPNPGARVTIRFDAPEGVVRARVLDVAGRLVRTLLDRSVSAGRTDLPWDGRDQAGRPVAAGVYYVRLTTLKGATSERVTLLR